MNIAFDRVQLAYLGGRSVPGHRQYEREQLRPEGGNGLDLQLYGNPVYIWYLGAIPDFANFCMDELHTKVPRTDKSTGKTLP
jgi:hypothetical protein